MIRSPRAVKSLPLDRRRISSVLTTFRPTLDTNDDEHGTFPFFPQTHALFHLLFATTCLFFLLSRVIRGSGQPRVSYETDLPANGGVTFFFL